MWLFLGVGAGIALGKGFVGKRKQHWAVRVWCAVLAVVLTVVVLAVGWVGGRLSPAWEVFGGLVPGFVVTSVCDGVALLVGKARVAGRLPLPWAGNLVQGRRSADLDDSDRQLAAWQAEVAHLPIHGTAHRRPIDRSADEAAALMPTAGLASFLQAMVRSRTGLGA